MALSPLSMKLPGWWSQWHVVSQRSVQKRRQLQGWYSWLYELGIPILITLLLVIISFSSGYGWRRGVIYSPVGISQTFRPESGILSDWMFAFVVPPNLYNDVIRHDISKILNVSMHRLGVESWRVKIFVSFSSLSKYHISYPGIIAAAVSFNALEIPLRVHSFPSYKRARVRYAIHMPATTVPDVRVLKPTRTDSCWDTEDVYSNNECLPSQYVTSGFLAIQATIDDAILDISTRSRSNELEPPTTLRLIQQMPQASLHLKNSHMSVIAAILLSLTMVPLIFSMLSTLVVEQECGPKVFFFHLGLRQGVLWSAWWMIYTTVMCISSLFIAFICKVTLFRHTTFCTIVALNLLYGLATISYSFFILSFSRKAQWAAVMGSVSIGISSPLLLLLQNPLLWPVTRWLLALFPPLAFGMGIMNVLQNNISDVGLSLGISCSLLLVDAILYMGLANIIWKVSSSVSRKHKPSDNIFSVYAVRQFIGSIFKRRESRDIEDLNSSIWPENTRKVDTDPSTTLHDDFIIVDDVTLDTQFRHGIRKDNDLEEHTDRAGILAGVSFHVHKGEIFNIVGTRGSGKSALVAVIAGVIEPSHGSIIGVTDRRMCSQYDIFLHELTLREHLFVAARISGVPRANIVELIDLTLATLGMTGMANASVASLETGMRRLLTICLSNLSEPTVLVLDEPTHGMDISHRRKFYRILELARAQNRSIVMTTCDHADEISFLADRTAVLEHGRIRYIGKYLEITDLLDCGNYVIFPPHDASVNWKESVLMAIMDAVPYANVHSSMELPYILIPKSLNVNELQLILTSVATLSEKSSFGRYTIEEAIDFMASSAHLLANTQSSGDNSILRLTNTINALDNRWRHQDTPSFCKIWYRLTALWVKEVWRIPRMLFSVLVIPLLLLLCSLVMLYESDIKIRMPGSLVLEAESLCPWSSQGLHVTALGEFNLTIFTSSLPFSVSQYTEWNYYRSGNSTNVCAGIFLVSNTTAAIAYNASLPHVLPAIMGPTFRTFRWIHTLKQDPNLVPDVTTSSLPLKATSEAIHFSGSPYVALFVGMSSLAFGILLSSIVTTAFRDFHKRHRRKLQLYGIPRNICWLAVFLRDLLTFCVLVMGVVIGVMIVGPSGMRTAGIVPLVLVIVFLIPVVVLLPRALVLLWPHRPAEFHYAIISALVIVFSTIPVVFVQISDVSGDSHTASIIHLIFSAINPAYIWSGSLYWIWRTAAADIQRNDQLSVKEAMAFSSLLSPLLLILAIQSTILVTVVFLLVNRHFYDDEVDDVSYQSSKIRGPDDVPISGPSKVRYTMNCITFNDDYVAHCLEAEQGVSPEITLPAYRGVLGNHSTGKSVLLCITDGVIRPTHDIAILAHHRPLISGALPSMFYALNAKEILGFIILLGGADVSDIDDLVMSYLRAFDISKSSSESPLVCLKPHERYLCTIAFSLASSSEILLLDEPTYGLSSNVRQRILPLLLKDSRSWFSSHSTTGYRRTTFIATRSATEAAVLCTNFALLGRENSFEAVGRPISIFSPCMKDYFLLEIETRSAEHLSDVSSFLSRTYHSVYLAASIRCRALYIFPKSTVEAHPMGVLVFVRNVFHILESEHDNLGIEYYCFA